MFSITSETPSGPTALVDKVPHLGSLLCVTLLSTEAESAVPCSWSPESPLRSIPAQRLNSACTPLPGMGGRPGQVCTCSESDADASCWGMWRAWDPEEVGHTCWMLSAPGTVVTVSMRGSTRQQMSWLIQRVTEHSPVGAPQGDTEQRCPHLHLLDTLSRVLLQFSLIKGLYL